MTSAAPKPRSISADRQPKALLVEDDLFNRCAYAGVLHDLGYACYETDRVREAANMLRAHDFDILLLDLRVTDGLTMSLVDYIGVTNSQVTVVMITGSGAFPNGEAKALCPRIDYVLHKPVNLSDLAALLDYSAGNLRA